MYEIVDLLMIGGLRADKARKCGPLTKIAKCLCSNSGRMKMLRGDRKKRE